MAKDFYSNRYSRRINIQPRVLRKPTKLNVKLVKKANIIREQDIHIPTSLQDLFKD